MGTRNLFDGSVHTFRFLFLVFDLTRFQELVVNGEWDEWYRQPAEVILQSRCDGMNIQVRVCYVVLVVGFEAALHLVDLARATTLPVDTFNVHT